MKQIKKIIIFSILLSYSLVICQNKPIQIEVYPSEIEDDDSIMANENVLLFNNSFIEAILEMYGLKWTLIITWLTQEIPM